MYAKVVLALAVVVETATGLYVTDKSRLWPTHNIYYEVPYDLYPKINDAIRDAVEYMNNVSCVQWVNINWKNLTGDLETVPPEQRHMVTFVKKPVWTRFIGYVKNAHIYVNTSLFLETRNNAAPDKRDVVWRQLVLRELMHSMGFENEHQRWDRDCYLWLRDAAFRASVPKFLPVEYETRWPYDPHSVMHLSATVPTEDMDYNDVHTERVPELGRADDQLSQYDIQKINTLYCGAPYYCEADQASCDRIRQDQRNTPECLRYANEARQ